MNLVETLKLFNRKERFWLLQHAIGDYPLSDKFRDDLSQLLSKETPPCAKIPCDAYWTIDYHFDWIAGAIIEFAKLDNKFPDAPIEQLEGKPNLVMGTQEDVDLLIAFENTLIFVECKAGGNWGQQITSKRRRIDLIKNFIDHIGCKKIISYFVTLSPKKNEKDGNCWLRLDYDDKKFSRVERCDKQKKAKASGLYWQVKKPKP